MIEQIPIGIDLLFLATCLGTLVLFYYANGQPKKLLSIIVLWSVAQSLLAYYGFYHNTEASPPRFGFVLIPSFLFIIYGLLPTQLDWIYRHRDTKISTFLHSVRLPVEIVLFQLYLSKMLPELMTFEGRNYDILMGITAPIVGYLFIKNNLSKKGLLLWNIIGLFLILFILINGILSSKLPFQQFGFEQPNIAMNYFPYILLPAVIVPIVIWTHVSDILKLRKEL